jgi:hypothetical protein
MTAVLKVIEGGQSPVGSVAEEAVEYCCEHRLDEKYGLAPTHMMALYGIKTSPALEYKDALERIAWSLLVSERNG